jgi:hypothetical protein
MNEQIKKTYIEVNNIENAYNELMRVYISNGFEIEDMTNGSFQVEHTLDWNESMLRGMLLESDLCKELEEKGIEDYSFTDLKAYASEYKLTHDTSLIDKLIEQYEAPEKLGKLEEKYISRISSNLETVIGNNLVSKYNEKGIINNDGKTVIEKVDKTPEQLASNHKKALMKAEELYVNEGELDRNSYMQTVNMINKLFDNYMHGPKKIPVEEFRKLQQNVEYTDSQSHIL